MLGIIGYELKGQLHRSARTLVYRGRRESDGLPVVLKLMAEEYPSFEDATRFKREYEIGRRVSGEGAVVVLALEPVRSNWAIVMEDLGARTLRSLLDERRLALEEALQLGGRLAAALAAVHRQNVIHKDINPSNIVIAPGNGEVRLIDFGLASLLPRESPTVLNPNQLEGTLRYISPEQTGRMNRAIDHRSDLYSLGVTLYEMVTGRVPFSSADAVELVHLHIAQRPVPPHELVRELPRPVSDVVMKLLAKTAEDRYQSALGLKSDLDACLGAWRQGARKPELGLTGFVPGRNDISSRFQLPQKLYGREPQVEVLMKALDRAARGRVELVLVGGESGMGKSVLVHEIQRPVLERRVHFLSGKFDQLHRDIPYAPLTQAFSDFVRQLLTLSEEQLGAWRQRLSAALGENARVVIEVLPVLERILGAQPPVPELSSQDAQHRFSFVFLRFVKALVSARHPLVLFLDDLQWADLPSLKLLQTLLTEPGIQHLLVVGAYRENEVGGAHPLRLMLENLEKEGVPATTLALAPLEPEHVVQLVSDTFRCDSGRSAPLARLLWERTGGNPFFIGQLLRALYEDKLIDFEPDAASWAWDVEVIRTRGLTESAIELMIRKLQKLPEATQQVLKLAACIGNRFSLASLAIVHGGAPSGAAAGLYPAIEEGLILPMDDRWRLAEQGGAADARYRFPHDRVQQAAYSLITEEKRAELHLRIARMLLASMTPGQLEEQIIDVVHQLNLGCSLVTELEERYEVARLNLLAGRKAKASAAFEPALRYFSQGLSLLPEDAWSQCYSLCFELHREALEARYLNAHIEQADALSELLLARVKEPVEQAKIFKTRITFATARRDLPRAINDGCQALELLGLTLPRRLDLPELSVMLGRVKELMATRSREELLGLPLMTDPRWIAASQVSAAMMPSLYISNAFAAAGHVFEMLELYLLHGHAHEAPYIYVSYGMILSGLLGEVEPAAAYGDIALELSDRLDAKHLRHKVLTVAAGYILHWKRHLRETFAPLREAVQAGLNCGDLEFVGYSATFLSTHLFFAGLTLDEVVQESSQYLELMKRWNLEIGSHAIRSIQQACLSLMGRSQDPIRLVGEAFDEDVELGAAKASGFNTAIARIHLLRTILACFFRDPQRAVAMSEASEAPMKSMFGHAVYLEHNFFQSLALLSAYGHASALDRARYLTQVERNQESMRRWAEHAPMNSLHRCQLVEAELARVRGDSFMAARLYEEAATGARKHRYLNEEALCHELEGEFLLSIGKHRLARDSFLGAAAAYRRWGAEAKVADLERRYPEAFARKSAQAESRSELSSTTTSSSGTVTSVLDLATVVKAAQTISGEIMLDPLLERLMRIVIENAGAQRGLLILEREGRLVIEVEQQVEAVSAIRLSKPVDGSTLLSASIVHFVARTRESVVLDDAFMAELFTRDPYVAERRLRSVLCMPLINQGRLVAVLYLENNHTTGAFTADRLEVLRLLSAQAALSLQNALLYAQQEEYSRTLEQRVEERTRELQVKNEELSRAMRQLRDTQKQLVAQEKLASLGALTAGIAHELKNPLNFISNFAELSEEYADELVKDSTPPSPPRSEEQGRMLLQLRQSVAKIREHSHRANQIINGMLRHSREPSSTRAPTDLNEVLAESLYLGHRAFSAKVPGFEVDIRTDYTPGGVEVDGVFSELCRVFINVVDNACYALRRKQGTLKKGFSPRLEVSTRVRGERAEVRIRDNGTGIPEEQLGKVFTPFFTTKPAGEGTGLGLSLSHDIIVSGHQGSMRVESVEGEFTELIIELPKRAPTA